MLDAIRQRLAAVPDTDVPPTDARLIDELVARLGSDEAIVSLSHDSYWPKWDSPWWHMLLLWELGYASRIPGRAVRAMVDALNALPLHIFPIRPEEWPPGADRHRDTSCHCALGSMDQVLSACGVDVDGELPCVKPWFERYQMADGGLNCDESAYLVEGECPSSMVGTVAPIEAMTRRGASAFLERGIAFLEERELVNGSATKHNADERAAAPRWRELCFPRFYFYDVLRGLTALTRATERVPVAAVAKAIEHMLAIAPDGVVRIGRRAYASAGSHVRGADGSWHREPRATTFALLEAVSVVGAPSAALTREWQRTRRTLLERLI